MTAQTDPYVRVYYSIIDDDKFAEVYDNNDRLATWLRLFLTADGTYPAPAPIPFGVHKASLAHLVKVGLVDLEPGHRYRIHGLAAERERRSEQARAAAKVRHDKSKSGDGAPPAAPAVQQQSDSSAAASDTQLHSAPLRSEPLQSDPLRATPEARMSIEPEDGLPHITPEVQEAAEACVGTSLFRASDKVQTDLDGLVERVGAEAVIKAFPRITKGKRMAWPQLVYGTRNLLEPIGRVTPKEVAVLDEADAEERARQKRLKATADYMAWFDQNAKGGSDAA